MMKKLLIFMLVLGMASAASATLSFYIGDSPAADVTIVVNETLTIQLHSDDAENWLGYAVMDAFTDPLSVGSVSSPVTYASAGELGGMVYFEGFGTGGYEATSTSIVAPTAVVAGVQHTFDYTSSVEGNAYFYFYDDRVGGYGSPAGAVDSFVVTVIPEPMTIVLLGLGGLFLRRRKK